MKKLIKLTMVAVMTVAVVGGGTVLAQDDTGSIDNTGPGSDNTITVEEVCDIVIKNEVDININNDSDQDGTSGDGVIQQNTDGGNVVSGDVVNEGSVDTNLVIDLATEADLETCKLVTAADNGDNGGDNGDDEEDDNGAVGGGQVAGSQTQDLPETGPDSAAEIALIAATATVSVAVIGRLGLAAYTRLKV